MINKDKHKIFRRRYSPLVRVKCLCIRLYENLSKGNTVIYLHT